MSKAIELAIEADSATGFPIACIEAQKIKPFLERFYALSRADLEAANKQLQHDLNEQLHQVKSYDSRTQELEAENAKLRDMLIQTRSSVRNDCNEFDRFMLRKYADRTHRNACDSDEQKRLHDLLAAIDAEIGENK